MKRQKTIKREITFNGIGVHSGQAVSVTIRPAQVNSGIIIRNKNFPNVEMKVGEIIPEVAMHATVIKNSSFSISTIEHLMAAIVWFEIDNVVIETKDCEIPILDGSAAPFIYGLLDVQTVEQDEECKFLTPKEKLLFSDDKGRLIEISPAKQILSEVFDTNLYIDYHADFNHPLVGKSNLNAVITKDFFVEHIAPARTFGFLEQLPFLKKHDLARGTSLGNTVVIGQDDFLNNQRCADEFIKHKLLDLLGDLGLLGKRLAGTVRAQKTGHSFNRLVVEHFIKNPDKWMLI